MQRIPKRLLENFGMLAKQTFAPKSDLASTLFNQTSKAGSLGAKLTPVQIESIKEAGEKTQENHRKFSAY